MTFFDSTNPPVSNRLDFIKHYLGAPIPDIPLDDLPVTSVDITAAVNNGIKPFLADLEYKGLRRPIDLYGPTGSGKTLLAQVILNHIGPWIPDRCNLESVKCAGTADNILWCRGEELPDLWKSGSQRMHQTADQAKYHQGSCLLCILDDLDKCPAGTWSASLLGMLDFRLRNLELITIVTMNMTPSQFAEKHDKAGDYSGRSILDRFRRRGGIFIRLNEQAKPVQPQEVLIG